ncbi:MAG: sensor domain-containing diguanylate cyclase [Deltaproteobacteria bacterium]|nr:sensor domain-containing diguanylate cyclase [Deltaproteobacteria bacterium]
MSRGRRTGDDHTEETAMKNKRTLPDEQFFRRFAELSHTWESWSGPDGSYLYVTPACRQISGYTPEDFYRDRRLMEKIIHPDHLKSWRRHLENISDRGEHLPIDFPIVTKGGGHKWISHACRPVVDGDGRLLGIRSSNFDITARKETEKALEQAARIDPLTGLLNRRAFMMRLKEEKIRFLRSGRPFCLVMVDIDHFKKINDSFGHNAGDEILRKIAQLISNSLRSQDAVSRWGGEEFLLLLPETGLAGGRHAAEKLRRLISEYQFPGGEQPLRVTISLGVAAYQGDLSLDACLKKVDDNLYLAKKRGRNLVVAG